MFVLSSTHHSALANSCNHTQYRIPRQVPAKSIGEARTAKDRSVAKQQPEELGRVT